MTLLGLYGTSDSGKTTIIEALTHSAVKKYKVQAQKGITLKVGYAHYKTPEDKLRYFIDAPGHLAFFVETLRNMDLMGFGIYVLDCIGLKNPVSRKQILSHYMVYSGLLCFFKIPYLVVLNKAETVDTQILEKYYQLIEKTNNKFLDVVPVCALLDQSIEYLKEKIEAHLKVVSAHQPVAQDLSFRVIKSFDVNPVGKYLTQVKGGVLGGYWYGATEPTTGQKLYYYDDILSKWNSVTISKVLAVGSGIYTFETGSDPFFFKNDRMKGVWFLTEQQHNKLLNNTTETQKQFAVSLDKIYQPIQKNDLLGVLSGGQYYKGVVKAVKHNKLYIAKKDMDSKEALQVTGMSAIVIKFNNHLDINKNEILGVGRTL